MAIEFVIGFSTAAVIVTFFNIWLGVIFSGQKPESWSVYIRTYGLWIFKRYAFISMIIGGAVLGLAVANQPSTFEQRSSIAGGLLALFIVGFTYFNLLGAFLGVEGIQSKTTMQGSKS